MKEFLDKVYNFTLTMDEDTLVAVFGENLGKHLWGKYYYDVRRDWMRWYGYLDHNNRQKISDYIENLP